MSCTCTCTGWAKNGTMLLFANNFSNINQFLIFFPCWNREKFVVTFSLKIPPHLICVLAKCRHHTQAGDNTDQFVINVDHAWPVVPKQPRLKSGRLCCLEAFNRWSINVDNLRQSASWSRRSSLSGAICCRIWLIVSLVVSIAGLRTSSISKADILNIWRKNFEMCQLLWRITEIINRLFFG